MFFCLITLRSARVSELVSVLGHSPCERIGKWEICPNLKEDRSFVRVWMKHDKNGYTITCIERDSF
jgi:hypothetical protein